MIRPSGWWAAVGVALAVCQAGRAQVTTLPVLKRTLTVVANEEAKSSQVLFVQVDHVERGFSKTQTYTLTAGSTYRVWAIGDDDRILDIDLEVLDKDGDRVVKDDDDRNEALVQFRVSKTQHFTLKVVPYKMKEGVKDGFYSLVVVRVD
jgi:hypothetical protein